MGKIFDFILRAVNFRVIGTTDEIVGKMHKHDVCTFWIIMWLW